MKTFTHIYSTALTGCMMKCLTCIFFLCWNLSLKVDWNGIGFYFRSWSKSYIPNCILPVFLWLGHIPLFLSPKSCLWQFPSSQKIVGPVFVMFMLHTTQNHFTVDVMPALEDHQRSWKTSIVEWKRALNLNQRYTGNLWLAHFLVASTLMRL